ncbi:histamine H3 receptor [Nematostella vectensis]|uniref:histamine H3 receptor n=1 Tax=Nematostella vectensis TaxID=45351 RepID=UPI00207727A5|nr:histamine H3 receptor [Nematostella vectensis]
MAPLWLSAFALLDVLIVIGNMLTILTFIHSPHLRRRSMYLIINLAVADLLIGLIPLPIFFSGFYYGFIVKLGIPRLLALLHTPLDSWLGLVSIFNLVLISIERLLAMVFPLRNRRISGRVYRYIISVSWLLPGIIVGLHSWVMFHGYRFTSLNISIELAEFTVLLHYLNSVINPIFYVGRISEFKRSLIKLLCKRCRNDDVRDLYISTNKTSQQVNSRL